MMNAYTVSGPENLLDMEMYISNFWATDTANVGSSY